MQWRWEAKTDYKAIPKGKGTTAITNSEAKKLLLGRRNYMYYNKKITNNFML